MGKLVSIYVIRPLIAIAACVGAGTLVDGPADDFAKVAIATPTVVALLLCVIDWERMAFGAAGFSGAAALGLTVAGREAGETITGYDLTFLVNWAIISVVSGVPVYGIFYVWGAIGGVRLGIDELVELQHDRRREYLESDGGSSDAGGSGPGPVGTIAGVPLSLGPTGPGASASAPAETMPQERPANFAAEELLASLEAYQVNGQPWWKCNEPHVLVQYRHQAQMEIESRVVPFLGWTQESSPPRGRGASVQRKPGMFTFNFRMGTALPDDDLTVMWVRNG